MPNIPLHRSFIHVSWHNHLKISKNEGDYEGLNDFFKRKTTYNIGVYVRMRRSGDDVYRFVWWHIQSRGLVLSKWRTIFFYSPIRKNNSRTFGKVVACSPMPSQCSRGKRQEGQKVVTAIVGRAQHVELRGKECRSQPLIPALQFPRLSNSPFLPLPMFQLTDSPPPWQTMAEQCACPMPKLASNLCLIFPYFTFCRNFAPPNCAILMFAFNRCPLVPFRFRSIRYRRGARSFRGR